MTLCCTPTRIISKRKRDETERSRFTKGFSSHVINVELSWRVSFVSRFVLCYLTSRIIVASPCQIDNRINDPLSFGDYMGQRYYIFKRAEREKFRKRRKSLFKKANELSSLCHTDLYLVMYQGVRSIPTAQQIEKHGLKQERLGMKSLSIYEEFTNIFVSIIIILYVNIKSPRISRLSFHPS